MTNGNETATGYLSEASKKKFTLTAGILGAAFLIGQFLLPMLLMFGLMADAYRPPKENVLVIRIGPQPVELVALPPDMAVVFDVPDEPPVPAEAPAPEPPQPLPPE